MAQKRKSKKRDSVKIVTKGNTKPTKANPWVIFCVVGSLLFLIVFVWLLIDAKKLSFPTASSDSLPTKQTQSGSTSANTSAASNESFATVSETATDIPESGNPQTLADALKQWIDSGANGPDVSDFLYKASPEVATPADARAVCNALDTLYKEPERNRSGAGLNLNRVLLLFQNVSSQPAFSVLRQDGLPRIRKWVRDAKKGGRLKEFHLMLKILAAYKCEQDVELIAEAALRPGTDHPYMWNTIFSMFNDDHPYAEKLVEALRHPLPEGVRLTAFLNLCTDMMNDEIIKDHPFNANAGIEYLRTVLSHDFESDFADAEQAAMTIPFLAKEHQSKLIELAESHPEIRVQIKAAWANAKVGNQRGVEKLKTLSSDVHWNYLALRHLRNLGLEQEAPPEATDESMLAMGEMSFWLQHPQEFGRAPDKIELYDKRELIWPPLNEKRKVYLVKYVYDAKDAEPTTTVGVGMVGTTTFALFGEPTDGLPPEDIYGLHCCWELMGSDNKEAPDERTAEAGRKILAKHNEGF
jgi:hypothetical protein